MQKNEIQNCVAVATDRTELVANESSSINTYILHHLYKIKSPVEALPVWVLSENSLREVKSFKIHRKANTL